MADNEKNFRGNRKYRRFQKKQQQKDRVDHDQGDKSFTFNNDFSWYNKNPQLARAAAQLSFGLPSGNTVVERNIQVTITGGANPDASTMTQSSYPSSACPIGLVKYSMASSIGCKQSASESPVGVASKAIFAWVRHENSGHTNYVAPDLMVYLLAMREVYGFCGWLTRIYALLNTYADTNRYLGKAICTMMNIDYDDFMEHLADFRFYCCAYFKRVDSLNVPSDMPLFKKAFWMFANVFAEDRTSKTQLYFFDYGDGESLLKWDPTTYATGI